MNGSGVRDGWSIWPAPAKLNLFLRITGRRADGYHELQTLFRMLDWGDTLQLRARADGRIVRDGSSAPGVEPAGDLAVRAAIALQKAVNGRQGADIRVEKRIPAGAGFGGGSSDAATALVALNAIWGLGVGASALGEIGLQLGADVPVFVQGDNAWGEGVGERLLALDVPPAWYVLADPCVHVDTTQLFQATELTRDAPPVTMADWVSGRSLGNAFEAVVRRREPAVEAMFRLLARIGEPRLTGTGSGCFVEFGDRGSALAGLAALPPGTRAWVAAGVARSPLQAALATWRAAAGSQ